MRDANSCVGESPLERALHTLLPSGWNCCPPPPSQHIPRRTEGQPGPSAQSLCMGCSLYLQHCSPHCPPSSSSSPDPPSPHLCTPGGLSVFHGCVLLQKWVLWCPLQAPRASHLYNRVQSILAGRTPHYMDACSFQGPRPHGRASSNAPDSCGPGHRAPSKLRPE